MPPDLAFQVLKNVTEEGPSFHRARGIISHDYLDVDASSRTPAITQAWTNHAKRDRSQCALVLLTRVVSRRCLLSTFLPVLNPIVDGTIADISPTMLKDKVLMIGLEGEGTIDLNPQPTRELRHGGSPRQRHQFFYDQPVPHFPD